MQDAQVQQQDAFHVDSVHMHECEERTIKEKEKVATQTKQTAEHKRDKLSRIVITRFIALQILNKTKQFTISPI